MSTPALNPQPQREDESDAELNVLIEAYLHDEADEGQLRQLEALVRSDPRIARRLALMSMMQARFRAEADPAFAPETMASAGGEMPEAESVRRIMAQIKERRSQSRILAAQRGSQPRLKSVVQRPGPWKVVKSRIALITISTAAVIMIFFGASMWAIGSLPVAFISLTNDTTTITRNGRTLHPADHDPLYTGDILSAGEEPVTFQYVYERTAVCLRPGTQVSVNKQGEQKNLSLLSGRLDAVVAPQPAGCPMMIATSHADFRIVGTRFALHEDSAASDLEVEEGKVHVMRSTDKAAVDVPAGNAVRTEQSAPLSVTRLDKLSDGLIAYWPMDENGGYETKNVGLGGEASNINSLKWTAGRKGSALEFDGKGFVDISKAQLNFAGDSAFTVSAWFKTTQEYGVIFSLRNAQDEASDIDIAVGSAGGGNLPGRLVSLIRAVRMGGPYTRVEGSLVNDGAWHHVAITRSLSGILEMYLDGASQGRSPVMCLGSIRGTLCAIGSERFWAQVSGGAGWYKGFSGSIDEVRVYNRALTGDEIHELAK